MGYRRMTLAELLGDLVAFRSLTPQEEGLPGFFELRGRLGLSGGHPPRKGEAAYARVVVEILREAQARRGARLHRLLYLGDTKRNDALTIKALSHHLPIRGFIAAESREEPKRIELKAQVMFANRWEGLAAFQDWLEDFPVDEGTALILDLDKTAFGARGRNDGAVDSARMAALYRMAEETLGQDLQRESFKALYLKLNKQEYHSFTRDNQDYLAYICLMATGGAYPPSELLSDLSSGRLHDLAGFIRRCQENGVPPRLLPIHQEVSQGHLRGDPTPFKGFRRWEYRETVARMDRLPDTTPKGELLKGEIVLTPEVIEFCHWARGKGALLFGLTDKPDEASLPTPELRAQGYLPLHHVPMKLVGP
ncbi:hypothetical protein H5T52_02585 [Candidatus Bipolaricaulota bacterium]|nr:hypothetical protein [Candidatus Bipolaricaulota bacterium]